MLAISVPFLVQLYSEIVACAKGSVARTRMASAAPKLARYLVVHQRTAVFLHLEGTYALDPVLNCPTIIIAEPQAPLLALSYTAKSDKARGCCANMSHFNWLIPMHISSEH